MSTIRIIFAVCRLPFAVNVMLNLSIDRVYVEFHLKIVRELKSSLVKFILMHRHYLKKLCFRRHVIDGKESSEEILLVTSCYGNRDKLRPDGSLGSYAVFSVAL